MNKTFKCNLCGKELSRRSDLNRHILGQHERLRNYGLNRFKCNLCPFETYMKSSLLKHSRAHTNERPFKCTVVGCELAFKDEKTVREHFKYKHSNERPLKCEFQGCQFTAKTRHCLRQHMKVHSDNRPFACPNPGCDFRAKTRFHITPHVASVHSETKPFACSKCKFKTARADALDYHMACHSTTRDFKCSHPTCKKSFKRPLDLKRHFSNSHGRRNFHCDHPGCRKKFANTNALYKHKSDNHSKKKLVCPEQECRYRTNHPSLLARHRIVHERRNEKISCSVEGCDYRGMNSEAVDVHMRCHKTLSACPESGCSQPSHTKEKLKGQIKMQKPSARPLQCPLCFKYFRRMRSLQDHCFTHTNEKLFMCGYCDYATVNHLQIKNHTSLIHPNVQFPFVAHLQDLRECLRCRVILPSAQFLIHSMTHAVPIVMIDRIKTGWS